MIDRGRIVSAQEIRLLPKGREGKASAGYMYEFRRKDGTVQKLSQINGDYFPKGTEIVVVAGDRLRVADARTFAVTPVTAKPGPVGDPGRVVSPVVIQPQKEMTISQAAERATGKAWNEVYCQTEKTLGSNIPHRNCMTLRDWDIRHQELERFRDFFNSFYNPGPRFGGPS